MDWKAWSGTLSSSFSSSSSLSFISIVLFVASILLVTAAAAPGVASSSTSGMCFISTTLPFLAAAKSMATLPPGVVKYSQVPAAGKTPFTKSTIPKGLLKRHNTKDGTWGIIQVNQGKLQYVIDEGSHKGIYNLDPQTRGVIEPQVFHSVAPITDNVSFVVEFYRYPGTGAVDEKREGL
jgi:tellurite resistance-related uncharacterized protein